MSTSQQVLVVPLLKDILFATDFSPASEAALPVLRSLALCCGSTVHLVHVIPAVPAVPLGMTPELDSEYIDADDDMRLLLASEMLRDVACTFAVQRGDVGEVLNELARKKHANLIVLGTHGRRGLEKVVLGSTAEQVIRTAPCPVLTVGPHLCRENPKASLGPIIVPLDLGERPHPAVRFAASLARANHARLVLLQAIPPSLEASSASLDSIPFTPGFSAELTARAIAASRRQMEELTSAEQLQDLNPQMIVEIGLPADLIVRTAQESQAGLIVMGAHRTGMDSVTTHLPWATASAILCRAPCPVMSIHD